MEKKTSSCSMMAIPHSQLDYILNKTKIVGHTCEGSFFIELFEGGRSILNPDLLRSEICLKSGPSLLVAAYTKVMEEESACFLSACPCSCWQVYSFPGIRACFFRIFTDIEDEVKHSVLWTEQLLVSWTFCGRQPLLDYLDHSL